jgi:predicted ATP-dependent endonuclease of OLD family
MQINKLWISKYKNLSNVGIEFKSNLVSLLVGNNGLGKSNLIEVLLILFVDLKKFESEEDMIEWSASNFQFIINYNLHDFNFEIHLAESQSDDETPLIPKFFKRDLKTGEEKSINFREFKKNRLSYLPEQLIGYYSGENKRLLHLAKEFQKNEHKRLLRLARAKDEKVFDESLRPVFICENHHSPLILLTVCLFSYRGKAFSHFKDLINDYLSIEEITEFSIRFNNPDWNYEDLGSPSFNRGMDFLLENIQNELDHPFWNLAGKVDRLLTRFYNYDIERGRDPIFYPSDGENKKEFEKEILEFADIKVDKFADELKDIFVEPNNFFDALESTQFLDILKDLKFKIKKTDTDELIEYQDLSEGEQQLLTTIGLLILFSNKQTLFLYDEPDTHLNPNWQRDFVYLLEKFNQDKLNNQIVLATHSPLIVQSSKSADVFLFKKDGNKVIVDPEDHQIHNWRIDQVLSSDYFDLKSARPRALDEFMELREKILSKKEITKADIEILEAKRNEFGVLPTGETLTDIKALHLIRMITDKS